MLGGREIETKKTVGQETLLSGGNSIRRTGSENKCKIIIKNIYILNTWNHTVLTNKNEK